MNHYIPQLNPHAFDFPDVSQAVEEPQGLLAWGGDLSPARLLAAYQQGIFPWYSKAPILWWAPSPRMVIQPAQVHISKSMQKTLRQNQYTVTFDHAFQRVINHCAKVPRNTPANFEDDTRDNTKGSPKEECDHEETHTWINQDMIHGYSALFAQGYAHSVEAWHGTQLVGGLYGVCIGKLFFGESMFSLVTNASKIAFIALCRYLQTHNFSLIDCQLPTNHLRSLGAVSIDMPTFQHYLHHNQLLGLSCHWPDSVAEPLAIADLLTPLNALLLRNQSSQK